MIVWVNYGAREQHELTMPLVLRQFPPIWSAIPEVIAAASELFRARLSPMQQRERAHALSIWGIEIEPYSETATYHVGIDHQRWSLEMSGLELPPDHLVYVTRVRDGTLLAQAD